MNFKKNKHEQCNTLALANFVYRGETMSMQRKFSLSFARIKVVALATIATMLLLIASPIVFAKQGNTDSEWSEWKPLSSGYAARRRVPAKSDMPATERRLENVQERLLKVQQLREHLLVKEVKSGKSSVGQQARLTKLDNRIKRIKQRENRLAPRQPSLWLRTDRAGLYSVSIADLSRELAQSARKIREKARRGRLELTNAGTPVSWYLDQTTDSILFAGEQYETFYTGQNAYHFKLSRTSMSQSMPIVDGAPTGSAGDAVPFSDSLIFEEEPDFMYSTWTVASEQDADYWFWDYLYGGYRDLIEVSLTIPDPTPFGTAQMRLTMRGFTNLEPGDEHQVYAELNGQPVGTMITWDGFEEAQLVADFDQSLLNIDGNNTLGLHNSYSPGTHPGQWLDQVDINYSRMPVAINDTLWLHNVEGGTQVVTGFTSEDILVIQSPAGSAAMLGDVQVDANEAGEWSVSFKAVEGADYLVAERSMINIPTITSDNAAQLTETTNSAEYLIIAPRGFTGTAEALAAYQRDRFATVKIVWLDDIYNEFSYGLVDPAAIGRFMQQTGAWSLSPSYVVLIGKGSLDEKNRMGYSDSFLPVLMATTPWALAPSDDRLLGVDGNGSFAIGRIPITNDGEGMAYVDKLIAHESATPGAESFQAVLAADNPDDAGDFHLNSDLLAEQLLGSYGFTGVTKLYHPDDQVRADLTLSNTWEIGYVGYDGHGSAAQIGDYREEFINAVDAAALQNSVYPIFTALTCAVADDSLPGTRSLAGSLVLNPHGGAIVSMAPTGLSLDADAQLLGRAFVDSLFAGSKTIGEAVNEAKVQTNGSISEFMPRIFSVVGDPSVYGR